MKSEEKMGNKTDESVAGDVAAAINLLRRLVRGRRLDAGLEGIDVSIGEEQDEPKVVFCKVIIKGDTTADRDAIKAKFPEGEGWKCKNTGPKTAECNNPPPKE